MPDPRFPDTRWSVVNAARHDGDEKRAAAALETLCQDYWYPVYAWVRRSGKSASDAEDLTQGFFQRLLEKNTFSEADASRGRLRSYLLGAMKHYLSDEWDKSQAQKRGGGADIIHIDAATAENRYKLEPADLRSPDVLYERRWALTALDHFIAALRAEYEESGKGEIFDALVPWLSGNPEEGYAEIAGKLGISEGTARVAVHRLRKRYADVMRREIAHTVDSEEEIEDELQTLLRALSAGS